MFISYNIKFTFHSTAEFWCMLWCTVISTDCCIMCCSVWIMLQSGLLSFKWFVSTNFLKPIFFFFCVCMCDILPLLYNLFEQPLKWYYVKSISYVVHCCTPLLHLCVMSSPSSPFFWQCRATFYCTRVIRNSTTSTWDKNLNVSSKIFIFPTEQYFVW
jgi:hypothetical protein